jgi:hypothetical protein
MTMQGSTGVRLKITISSTLTAIVNLLDAPNFPEQVKFLADMTPHPTTGTTTYTKMVDSGMRQLTSFTVTLGWDASDSTHAAVMAAFDGTDPVGMSIEDPAGGEVIGFDAFIEKVGRVSALKDGYKASVMITPTGSPTIT